MKGEYRDWPRRLLRPPDSTGNSISPDDDGCVMNFSDLVLTALFLVPPISDVANEGKDL